MRLLFSEEDFSFYDLVSRLGHTYSLAFLFSEWLYFSFTLSVRVSQLCMWGGLLLDFPSWAFYLSYFWYIK